MNIYLVGFMGTGKTEVAKELAQQLKMKYVEMDDIIEKKEEKTITKIFQEDGEAYFREIEKEVAYDISKEDNQVISCGGGVVLDSENIKNFRNSGTIVCLWAEADIIYERTKNQLHRPVLNVKDPKKKINDLLTLRKPFYEKADFKVDTSNLNIKEIAEKIIGLTKDKRK